MDVQTVIERQPDSLAKLAPRDERCGTCQWLDVCAKDRTCWLAESAADGKASRDPRAAATSNGHAGLEALQRMDAGEPQQPIESKSLNGPVAEPVQPPFHAPPTVSTRVGKKRPVWDYESIIASFLRYHRERGCWPTDKTARGVEWVPKFPTVAKHCGSWVAARQEAERRVHGAAPSVKPPPALKTVPQPDEAHEALLALGWKSKDAAAALTQIDATLPTEERVRAALQTKAGPPALREPRPQQPTKDLSKISPQPPTPKATMPPPAGTLDLQALLAQRDHAERIISAIDKIVGGVIELRDLERADD